MTCLVELWLPILVSGVSVFAASTLLHMFLPIHKGDYGKLPDEERVLGAMREHGVEPGQYTFPCPGSMKEMCTPEMKAKYDQGPVGLMIVRPRGTPNMGACLLGWFLYGLLVSLFVGYVTRLAALPGAEWLPVFRVSATVGVLAYGVTALQDSIWKGQRLGTSLKYLFDGLVYGLVTGVVFGWLWPAAS